MVLIGQSTCGSRNSGSETALWNDGASVEGPNISDDSGVNVSLSAWMAFCGKDDPRRSLICMCFVNSGAGFFARRGVFTLVIVSSSSITVSRCTDCGCGIMQCDVGSSSSTPGQGEVVADGYVSLMFRPGS